VTPGEHEIGVSYARSALDSAVVEERYESELTRSATVLDGVDQALERLSKGSYGTCDTCGDVIAAADLEGDPTRRHCTQHLAFTSPESD
jgi:RNA polymerase-binding transcription factor DksA